MFSFSEILYVLARLRVDALLSVGVAIAACEIARRYARQHGAEGDFSRVVCLTVVALALAGALLAEWTALVLGYPASTTLATLALARTAVLGAAVVLGIVLWRVVFANRNSSDFMIATEGEMKKVSWSTKGEVIGSTKVVILFTFLLAALLFVVDVVFQNLFQWIGVLKVGK